LVKQSWVSNLVSFQLLAAMLFFGMPCRGEGTALSPEMAKGVAESVKQLSQGSREKAREAYERLLKVGKPAAPIVVDGYAAANLTGRGMILQFLAETQYDKAVALLLEKMTAEEEGLLRGVAARAAIRSAPEDKQVLEKATEAARSDPDGYVQLVIANSLAEVLSRASIPYMISLLKEEVPSDVRRVAWQALRRCTREKEKCAFEPWNDWWVKNQDIFTGCRERAAPAEGDSR
jgi:HEAT repeat protein